MYDTATSDDKYTLFSEPLQMLSKLIMLLHIEFSVEA